MKHWTGALGALIITTGLAWGATTTPPDAAKLMADWATKAGVTDLQVCTPKGIKDDTDTRQACAAVVGTPTTTGGVEATDVTISTPPPPPFLVICDAKREQCRLPLPGETF